MTRKVKVGAVFVGGDSPVSVQTMYDIPLSRPESGLRARMDVLKAMGCSIMRVSYPDISEHDCLCSFVSQCSMPVVADIHFNWRNAVDSMDCGIAAVRINPGNIGARWKTEDIVRKALDKDVAIRIGLNSGSLPDNKDKKETARLMADTALEYISWFEKLGFFNTVVSLKASSPDCAYDAYSFFASQSDYPLHIGVTEAGGTVTSCVRSTWTLGRLLSAGIGDTLRYSITGSMENEVQAGVELLRTLGLRKGGIRIVSCPMCGRKSFDSQAFLASCEAELLSCRKDATVAIMGCQVNGPGEAKGADFAVSGIGNRVYLYKHGEIYSEVSYNDAKEELLKLLNE